MAATNYPAWSTSDFIYKGVMHSLGTPEILSLIENDFVFHSDDTLVCTYPKQGTTLVTEMVWLIKNKADVEAAKKTSLSDRTAFLELERPGAPQREVDKAAKLTRPRLLKSHLPWDVLQRGVSTKGVKVVHVMRNPKDSMISLFHFARNKKNWSLGKDFEFNKFYEMFRDGHCPYGSYFDYTVNWWAQRHRDNILFLKYEDILADKLGNVRRIAQFLDVQLSSEEEARVVEHTSFSAMQENPMV